MVSKWFNFIGWAYIVLGLLIAIFGLLSAAMPFLVSISILFVSIFGGMFYFAISQGLRYLQKTSENIEKILIHLNPDYAKESDQKTEINNEMNKKSGGYYSRK